MNAKWIEAHALRVLAVAVVAVFGIHCLTIVDYPTSWFDEIEILEMGRFSVFASPDVWSVNLWAENGTLVAPQPYFHYLSGAVLEGLYRLTGTHVAGRLAMLLSLPVCALALFAWLSTLGVSRTVALFAAALFLVDPNATICAHWYRPDIWCVVLVLMAHMLIVRSRKGNHRAAMLVLAGFLAVVSLCFWLSSVVLLPLLAFEVLLPTGRPEGGARRLFREALLPALGALIALAILLIPLYGKLPAIVGQYLRHSEVGSVLSTGPSFGAKVCSNAVTFAKIALRSPFAWLFALTGLACGRRLRPQAVAFLLVAGFIVATRVYHLRMAYLLPWIYLLVALALERLLSGDRLRLPARGLAALALMFGIGVSVIALTCAAWPAGNTLAALVPRLRAAVPETQPKVWLVDSEHECYYAGRLLGWRMFSTQPSMGTVEPPVLREPYAAALDGADAVVVSVSISEEGERTLRRHGFSPAARIDLPKKEKGRLRAVLSNFVYAHGYPPCTVWRRP